MILLLLLLWKENREWNNTQDDFIPSDSKDNLSPPTDGCSACPQGQSVAPPVNALSMWNIPLARSGQSSQAPPSSSWPCSLPGHGTVKIPWLRVSTAWPQLNIGVFLVFFSSKIQTQPCTSYWEDNWLDTSWNQDKHVSVSYYLHC